MCRHSLRQHTRTSLFCILFVPAECHGIPPSSEKPMCFYLGAHKLSRWTMTCRDGASRSHVYFTLRLEPHSNPLFLNYSKGPLTMGLFLCLCSFIFDIFNICCRITTFIRIPFYFEIIFTSYYRNFSHPRFSPRRSHGGIGRTACKWYYSW